ncbi:MAG: Gx transporter family protein [Oscillospiraceae bacterium]|nr:Gx transporter family protein [Oscillospiraceae bacterium]
MKTKRIALCGVFIALALALSYMERIIPVQLVIPLPGIKLGIANIVTLVALYLLDSKAAFLILVPRCVLGAVFGGGITGLLFSLAGGVPALLVMALAKKSARLSIYGVSILGAAVHNVGQILAAMVLMNSVYIGAYLPWLLLAAIATGACTGAAGAGVLRLLGNRREAV